MYKGLYTHIYVYTYIFYVKYKYIRVTICIDLFLLNADSKEALYFSFFFYNLL